MELELESKLSKHIIPKAKRNVGIFWDLVNCPVPNFSPNPAFSISSIVNLLQNVFVKDRTNFSLVKFSIITDDSKTTGNEVLSGNTNSNINIIEIDKTKRPAQRVLRDEIREFIKNFGHTSPVIVLVADHIQLLVKEIAYYKLEYDCYIALVYGPVCTLQLLPQWDEIYYFQTFCERLIPRQNPSILENDSNRVLEDSEESNYISDSSNKNSKVCIATHFAPQSKATNLKKPCKNSSFNLQELKKQVYNLKKLYENSILSKSGSQVQSQSYGKYKFWISLHNSKCEDNDKSLQIEEELKKFMDMSTHGNGVIERTETGGNDVWITFNDAEIALKNIEKLIADESNLLGKNFSLFFINNYLLKNTKAPYCIINRSDSDELHELKEKIWDKRQVSADDESIVQYFVTLTGFPTDLSPNEIQDDLVSFLEEISVHGTIEYVSLDGLACISFKQYEEVVTALNGINSLLFYEGSGYKLKMEAISSKQLEDLIKLKPTLLVTPCCEEKSIVTR